jgi:hypothetical protein
MSLLEAIMGRSKKKRKLTSPWRIAFEAFQMDNRASEEERTKWIEAELEAVAERKKKRMVSSLISNNCSSGIEPRGEV